MRKLLLTTYIFFVYIFSSAAAPVVTVNSNDEFAGNWDVGATWESGSITGFADNIKYNIQGTVTYPTDLVTTNKIKINVESYDTLIIAGDFVLDNNSGGSEDITIAANGVLILLDSLKSGNNLSVATGGKVIILGGVEAGGGSTSITNTGSFYALDGSNTSVSNLGGLDELLANENELVNYIIDNFPSAISKLGKTIYSFGNGNWSSLDWSYDEASSCGCTPNDYDSVVIKGNTVNIDNDITINSLTVANSSVASSLIIDDTKTLTVEGNVYVYNDGSGSTVGLTLNGSGILQVENNLEFNSGSLVSVNLNNTSLLIIENSIDAGSGLAQINVNDNAILKSNTSDILWGTSGNLTVTYENIAITDGRTYATYGDILVTNNLTLTNGIISLASGDELTLPESATISGGSASSFVDGPMRRTISTTSALKFPVGDNGVYAPVELELESASTSVYVVEYFNSAYADVATIQANSGMTAINASEYWDIHKESGVGCYAGLYYSEAVADINKVTLAHWTGSEWENKLATSVASGYMRSGLMTSFSPTTTGTSAVGLPISLISFEAFVQNAAVQLKWKTASEKNNDYFTVERSTDGSSFAEIATINGQGNSFVSVEYEAIDSKPQNGINYYRLKQTDYNGQYAYSNIRSVLVDNIETPTVSNVAIVLSGQDYIVQNPDLSITNMDIYNIHGELKNGSLLKDIDNSIVVETNNMQGIYFLVIDRNGTKSTQRLFVK